MKPKDMTFLLFALTVALPSALAATVTISPDGNGARTAWSQQGCSGAGNEWNCVDEGPANTSDYLFSTGTGKETFTFSNTGLTTEPINSVRLYYYAMQHNSAANACFAAMTRSGGTDYLSGTQLCANANWSLYSHLYTTNPSTGSAWTVSGVDALEAGMYGLNPNGGGRVAQVYAVVDYNTCGNGVVDGNETCDGVALDGQTCVSQGFSGGSLACNGSCTGFVTTGCYTDSCSDSDGGIVLTVPGNVSGYFHGSGYNLADSCVTGVTISERYCSGALAAFTNVSCATNTTSACVNGACV